MKSVAILGTRGYPSYYGGFETAVRKLAPYLVEAGWDVTVYGRPDGVLRTDPERHYGVKSIMTRGIETKHLSTLSYGFTSAMAAIRQKPDVVLVMNVANGFWLPLLKMRGIPTVVNVDGIEWERAKWGKNARKLFRLGARFTATFSNHLIADAREIRRIWEAKTHRKLEFIPYGGDVPRDVTTPTIVTPGGYALLVARFVPENSIDSFLDAAKVIAQTHDVVLVGTSGYPDAIEDRVRQLVNTEHRVTWLGHVSDDDYLHGLWVNAGVYFHGHSVGGTNPALVQAMACSTPIVARNTVYNLEVLDDAALYVEPNGASIAEACLKVLNDQKLRINLGRLAFERSRAIYSWESVCASYEQLLETAVESGHRHLKF
ncbi:glycosyltransferase [Arthrobacter glacialis]|uniref:glycosyltransferase n=1 Tax=Arthrobacter glacialis TaxID=1664 RepID=UPI000CD4125B|nr:glycosyltransferase [Arthrobacter glacialis]POH60671.1 glycosyl transferase [Arthrobacter glacialis]